MGIIPRCFIWILFASVLFLPYQQAQAQPVQIASDTTNIISGDTMWVAWQKTGAYGTTRTNALLLAILGDTANGGRANLNRVYKLKINGHYLESDVILNEGYHLRIIADPMDNIGTGNHPAIFQMSDTKGLINGRSDVTLKNIWVSGRTTYDGSQNTYQPIGFFGSNAKILIDGCVFERSDYAMIAVGGEDCIITVTNNKFRNLIGLPGIHQWQGRGISIWADQDSVIIENNTFFNIGFTTFQVDGGSAKYLRYNHNTLVNIGRGVMSPIGNWWQSAYFANNLIINGWWEGEGYRDMHDAGRDARLKYSGLFTVGDLPSGYGSQQSRSVYIVRNSAYLDPAITAKYGSPDTITRAWFIDPVSKEDYLFPYRICGFPGGNMHVSDTTWLENIPEGMSYYLTDPDWRSPFYTAETGATMIDSMWNYITKIRDYDTSKTAYFYHPAENPEITWPLPENFSYTQGSGELTGTDGLPLGDLNWFPADKAAFEANKDIYTKFDFYVDCVRNNIEAEIGTVGGTAAVAYTEGLTYYAYTGSGSITWTFDVPVGKGGTYDSKWLVNETGRGNSGPVLAIDGTTFVDAAHGWGQFVFEPTMGPAFGLSTTDWVWVGISNDSVTPNTVFTLTEGTHTIGVKSGGWGAVNFAEIDLALHGDADTIKLKAPSAVPVLVTPGAKGIKWVASEFKYVNLGTAGSIAIPCTTDIGGAYKIRIFGQNISGSDQTIYITNGDSVNVSAVLPNKSDSTHVDVISELFALNVGIHALTLSGGNANIDCVELIEGCCLGIDKENLKPDDFSLAQNYPNPFNPTTEISFILGKTSNVRLTVYELLGKKVATLIDRRMSSGIHSVVFDASRLSSGVYFYRLEAGSFVSQKKMLLLK